MNVLVFSLSLSKTISFFFFFISFLDFMSRIAVIWIYSPELSYVCHTFAMLICAPMWAEKFVIKILVSCILVYNACIIYETKCFYILSSKYF